MKEQELSCDINEDKTLVNVSNDIKKKAIKIYNNMGMNANFMLEQLRDGTLTEGMKETHISLVEVYAKEFSALFGYEGVLKKENEERHKHMRCLNEENRELRKQLGDKCSNEDLREKLKTIDEQFHKWWNCYGFGHCSKTSFTGYSFEVELSGVVTDDYYRDEDAKYTEEGKAEMLKSLGFNIADDGEKHIPYSDNNISMLFRLLVAKYPSVKLKTIKADYDRHNVNRLRSIEICITDFNDFD